jgi:hypothetical protein
MTRNGFLYDSIRYNKLDVNASEYRLDILQIIKRCVYSFDMFPSPAGLYLTCTTQLEGISMTGFIQNGLTRNRG